MPGDQCELALCLIPAWTCSITTEPISRSVYHKMYLIDKTGAKVQTKDNARRGCLSDSVMVQKVFERITYLSTKSVLIWGEGDTICGREMSTVSPCLNV